MKPNRVGSFPGSDVCRFLEWSQMEYTTFQFESGLIYLSAYLQEDWAVDIVKTNRGFWNWWKGHWQCRDISFIAYIGETGMTVEELQHFYRLLHNGEELARSIRPTAVVLNDSYAVMMQQLIDENI